MNASLQTGLIDVKSFQLPLQPWGRQINVTRQQVTWAFAKNALQLVRRETRCA